MHYVVDVLLVLAFALVIIAKEPVQEVSEVPSSLCLEKSHISGYTG